MGLDTVELLLAAEREFGVCIPDERAAQTETVEQFARLLCELRTQAGSPIGYEAALLHLRAMIAKMFGIPFERIVPHARLVKDLGLQ